VKLWQAMLSLTVFSLPAFAAEGASTSVTVAVMPEGHYSESSLREMGREAANILKKSGVKLRLRLGDPGQVSDSLLVVIMLKGDCEMDGTPSASKGPLGWSHEVDGKILPFGEVACSDIWGSLRSARYLENHLPGDVALGRAMGRVLAHELYHIVAATPRHGRDGVARKAFSTRELTDGQLDLDQSDAELIRSGLQRPR
jgi:hypothetical protein